MTEKEIDVTFLGCEQCNTPLVLALIKETGEIVAVCGKCNAIYSIEKTQLTAKDMLEFAKKYGKSLSYLICRKRLD